MPQSKFTWREYLAIGAILSSLILIVFFYKGYVEAKRSLQEYHCTDIHMTYEKAQELYKEGVKYLDNNHDGIACNQLLK